MTDRLQKIFSVLPSCEIFADIGCDHGYIAKAMIKSQKCERAIISDISEKCLSKAESLLSEEIKGGKVKSVVSNGFDNIDYCDLALIAGMGGQEIVDIVKRANSQQKLPSQLILQPMKNCDLVRITAVEMGYKVKLDKVFKSGKKFYNLIALEKGEDSLTEEEIEFGRDNILSMPNDFKEMMIDNINKLNDILKNKDITSEVKLSIELRIKKYKKYV